ncbi:MAG: hypothetical protein [Microviridae sp.]|nr:MAG: hypothetical protein [Microviridae sp.]
MMERFKLGSLTDWCPIIDEMQFTFEGGEDVRHSFEVLGASSAVYCVTEEGTFPVAFGPGLLDVDFSVSGPCTIVVRSPGGAFRVRHAPGQVPRSSGEPYVSLEPSGGRRRSFDELYERSMKNSVARNAAVLASVKGRK